MGWSRAGQEERVAKGREEHEATHGGLEYVSYHGDGFIGVYIC